MVRTDPSTTPPSHRQLRFWLHAINSIRKNAFGPFLLSTSTSLFELVKTQGPGEAVQNGKIGHPSIRAYPKTLLEVSSGRKSLNNQTVVGRAVNHPQRLSPFQHAEDAFSFFCPAGNR